MAPKKQQINPFSMYMREQEPILRRRGLAFNSKEELVAYLHPHFRDLPELERQKYKNIAKNERERQKADLTRKFDDRGIPLAQIEAEKQEERQKVRDMREHIARMVEERGGGGGELLDLKMYTMFATLHCSTDDGKQSKFIPCEVSLSEWTLADGVLRTTSFVVRTDDIPCGYKSRCRDISTATHNLPLDYEGGEANIPGLWIRLKNFINPQENLAEYPPVFTHESEVWTLERCLDWMYERAMDRRNPPFRVYPLSTLLYELLRAAGEPQLETYCSDQLSAGTHDYISDLACDFHSEADNSKNCARSMSQRYSFIIMDLVTPKFGVELVAGRHVPVNKDAGFVTEERPFAANLRPLTFKPSRETVPNLPKEYHHIAATRSQFEGIGWDMVDENRSTTSASRTASQSQRSEDLTPATVPMRSQGWRPGSFSQAANGPSQGSGLSSSDFPALGSNALIGRGRSRPVQQSTNSLPGPDPPTSGWVARPPIFGRGRQLGGGTQ